MRTFIAITCIIVGALSALWHFLLLANPWFLSAPGWLGLDRPAGLDELLAYRAAHLHDAAYAAMAGSILGLILVLAGVGMMMNRRWGESVATMWIIAKPVHAVVFAKLAYGGLQAQLAGIPDPQAPWYCAAEVELSTTIGIGVVFAIRMLFPIVLAVLLIVLVCQDRRAATAARC